MNKTEFLDFIVNNTPGLGHFTCYKPEHYYEPSIEEQVYDYFRAKGYGDIVEPGEYIYEYKDMFEGIVLPDCTYLLNCEDGDVIRLYRISD